MTQEIEFKWLVRNEADFRALARALRGSDEGELPQAALQVNTFFDTQDRKLSGRGIALRLREEEGRWELTLKGRASEQAGALTSRPESELVLEPGTGRCILAGVLPPLAPFLALRTPDAIVHAACRAVGGAELLRLGQFTNERRRLGPLPLGDVPELVFELDRTHFPGGVVEYEVELELTASTAGRMQAALEELFQRAGVPWTPSSSKAGRFFRRLEGSRTPDSGH